MKMTERTKQALKLCREERALTARGYRKHETDWEIHRGSRWREVIQDVIISSDGKYVFTKIGPMEESAE